MGKTARWRHPDEYRRQDVNQSNEPTRIATYEITHLMRLHKNLIKNVNQCNVLECTTTKRDMSISSAARKYHGEMLL